LIDVRQLEKTILIETYDQARGVMYKERPKNVDACFTLRAQKLQYQFLSFFYFFFIFLSFF